MLGLVLAARGRRDDALAECERELEFATRETVYTAEFMTNASVLRGCLLLGDAPPAAIEAFEGALRRVPGQGRAYLGLALAHRAMGQAREAAEAFQQVNAALERLNSLGRRSEAAIVDAARLAVDGYVQEAAASLERALTAAEPGPFGWSIPVEPFLAPAINSPTFARVRAILAERAS